VRPAPARSFERYGVVLPDCFCVHVAVVLNDHPWNETAPGFDCKAAPHDNPGLTGHHVPAVGDRGLALQRAHDVPMVVVAVDIFACDCFLFDLSLFDLSLLEQGLLYEAPFDMSPVDMSQNDQVLPAF